MEGPSTSKNAEQQVVSTSTSSTYRYQPRTLKQLALDQVAGYVSAEIIALDIIFSRLPDECLKSVLRSLPRGFRLISIGR